jgi:hypothetical protein|tara:strand:+ start:210 stop:362 length:153 start_codon:yes stop_codon:yes gene_type:complete
MLMIFINPNEERNEERTKKEERERKVGLIRRGMVPVLYSHIPIFDFFIIV